MRKVRGAVDVHIQQITDAPEFFVDVDRQLASEIGVTEQQIANSMNISLSGSYQVTPNFWSDPKSGIPYQLWVQTPEYRNASLTDIKNTPLLAGTNGTQGPSLTLVDTVCDLEASSRADRRQSRQHAAEVRYFRQRAGSRPRRCGPKTFRRSWRMSRRICPRRRQDQRAGPDRGHAKRVHEYRDRPGDPL